MCVSVCVYLKLSYERMFYCSRHMGGFFFFSENRHMVFVCKLSGKGACDVLLKQMLERTHDV